MTDSPLIHSAPGVTTALPTGTQSSAKYVLSNQDGSRAVFNDPTDVDYVGAITEITGLDSPEVRESAEDLSQMDGGVHGDFYYGRRPITITGIILNPSTMVDRNIRETKLRRASNALRADATLSWTLADGTHQYVTVRRQQPLRITGPWQKQFQLALVAADPLIYEAGPLNTMEFSDPEYNTVLVEGSTPVPFKVRIEGGPSNAHGILLENLTTGKQLKIDAAFETTVSHFLELDTSLRTAVMTTELGTNPRSVYSKFDYINSEWFTLQPGENKLRLTTNQDIWSFRGAGAYYADPLGPTWSGDIEVTAETDGVRVVHSATDHSHPAFVWGSGAVGGTDATQVDPSATYHATARFTVNPGTPRAKARVRALWTAAADTVPTSSPSNYETSLITSDILDPGEYFLTLPILTAPAGKPYLRILVSVYDVNAAGESIAAGYTDNDVTYHSVTLNQYGAGGTVTWRNAWI